MSQALRPADGHRGQQLELYRRLPSKVDPGVCKYVFSDGDRLFSSRGLDVEVGCGQRCGRLRGEA